MIQVQFNYQIKIKYEKEWIEYMKTVHIPAVINTRCFEDFSFRKILDEENSRPAYQGYRKFEVVYTASNQEKFNLYKEKYDELLEKEKKPLSDKGSMLQIDFFEYEDLFEKEINEGSFLKKQEH